MTSMDQIQIIHRRARAAGMSYGKYVALHPNIMPRPQDMSEYIKCKRCEEFFLPELTKDGTRRKRKHCQTCMDIIRREKKNPAPGNERKHRAICTFCGKEIETRKAPRKDRNTYCPECREAVKQLRRKRK